MPTVAPAGLGFAKSMTQLISYDVMWREIQTRLHTPDRRDLGVLAGAANEVGGGQRRPGGGPRTL